MILRNSIFKELIGLLLVVDMEPTFSINGKPYRGNDFVYVYEIEIKSRNRKYEIPLFDSTPKKASAKIYLKTLHFM